MREKMAAMQRQIEEFVVTVNREFMQQARRSAEEPNRSLIPVIQIRTASVQESKKRKSEPRKP